MAVPETPAAQMPRSRWPDLVRWRRAMVHGDIRADCRALGLFVEDAMETGDWLGFGSRDAYLRDGLGIEPAVVAWALDGLSHYGLDVPVPLAEAVELGRHGGDRRANQHARWGGESSQVGNAKSAPPPSSGGMCAAYVSARLRRDRPDLAAQVEVGALSAHAAAIEAGFRRKPTPLDELRRAWAKASPAERAAFVAERQQETDR